MMKEAAFILTMIILIIACDKNSDAHPGQPLIDIDGNKYDTVKINTQFWMQQNLKTSYYRNGDLIPEVTSESSWALLISGAWCWYDNDSAKYAAVYGKLYNWYAVTDPRGLAPSGWHIPSDAEWTALATSLGGDDVAGGSLKETGTSHWGSPNNDATDITGFKGLPGGYHIDQGMCEYVGYFGDWWSSTEASTFTSFSRELGYNNTSFIKNANDKRYGLSVRCLRD